MVEGASFEERIGITQLTTLKIALDCVALVTFDSRILLSQETFLVLKCQREGYIVRAECRSCLGNTIQIGRIHRDDIRGI